MKSGVLTLPNRVVFETPWVCWRLLGGCGHTFGLNFAGGACPHCEEYAVSRFKLVEPDPAGGAA